MLKRLWGYLRPELTAFILAMVAMGVVAATEGIIPKVVKDLLDQGFGGEYAGKLWQVPAPVPGSAHPFKYSLFYGYPGRRAVSYDNERGKGDHRHRDGQEAPYAFVSLDKLIADFEADVAALRAEEGKDG